MRQKRVLAVLTAARSIKTVEKETRKKKRARNRRYDDALRHGMLVDARTFMQETNKGSHAAYKWLTSQFMGRPDVKIPFKSSIEKFKNKPIGGANRKNSDRHVLTPEEENDMVDFTV